jgi:zinc transport system ATP-binding protein
MTAPPVLEIERLAIRRDGRRLMSGVDLDVAPGSIHVLVGPNGAGKSTLFAAVLGNLEFTGAIRFHWRGAGRIGWVPQSFAVDKTLPITVLDFLALSRQRVPVALRIGRRMRRRADALLARVGLDGFAPRLLGQLSGGELQRVLLANAIDPAPELLLLDEPASGLDERAVQALEETLGELKRGHGTAVLLVSHDLAQARRVADRVSLLDHGGITTGDAAKVLRDGLAGSAALRRERGRA